MSFIQKWLIVIAVWIAALGIFFGGFQGRYKYAFIDTGRWSGGRFDTWTGEVSIKNYHTDNSNKLWQWEGLNPNFVKDIQ